jgi:PPM family protein phosphatase
VLAFAIVFRLIRSFGKQKSSAARIPGYAMLRFETAGVSDIGKKRACNEDAFLIDDAHGLYVVADGMGGHLAGEVASAMVVDSLRTAVAGFDSPLPEDRDSASSSEADRLRIWIKDINRKVFERSQRDAQCRGMGSTFSALYCARGRAIVANVGDSPVYRVRAHAAIRLSAEHTVAAEQLTEMSGMSAHLPATYHHMLTRAIGIERDVHPHIQETDLCAGDVYLLCSDGISNAVKPPELVFIVQQAGARDACRRLVSLALERGGDDNATIVVIKVERGTYAV